MKVPAISVRGTHWNEFEGYNDLNPRKSSKPIRGKDLIAGTFESNICIEPLCVNENLICSTAPYIFITDGRIVFRRPGGSCRGDMGEAPARNAGRQ